MDEQQLSTENEDLELIQKIQDTLNEIEHLVSDDTKAELLTKLNTLRSEYAEHQKKTDWVSLADIEFQELALVNKTLHPSWTVEQKGDEGSDSDQKENRN